MIYALSGKILEKAERFAVIDVGGVGFRVAMPARAIQGLPPVGDDVKVFTHLHVREDALDIYGFSDVGMKDFFELLIDVNGIGPRSALAILDIADLSELKAAIQEGRPDLLTRAAGVGGRTAERIVLEMRGKVAAMSSEKVVGQMEGDADLVEALVGLGYKRDQARAVLSKIDSSVTGIEERLRSALSMLTNKPKEK